jgi:hypothetical protein
MSAKWTVFEDSNNRGVRRKQMRASLTSRKDLYINGPGREALGFPKAVELLFDATTSRMGIRPVNPKQQNSRLVYSKPDSKHATISVLAFCSRFNIKPEHRTIRFDDVYVDSEGILILDFRTAKNATRPNAKRKQNR